MNVGEMSDAIKELQIEQRKQRAGLWEIEVALDYLKLDLERVSGAVLDLERRMQ